MFSNYIAELFFFKKKLVHSGTFTVTQTHDRHKKVTCPGPKRKKKHEVVGYRSTLTHPRVLLRTQTHTHCSPVSVLET